MFQKDNDEDVEHKQERDLTLENIKKTSLEDALTIFGTAIILISVSVNDRLSLVNHWFN